jgi:hypothetical protein
MDTQFDIEQVLALGKLSNELDYERAIIADRKLRVLAKEDEALKLTRKKLRDIIADYEEKHWSPDSLVNSDTLEQSDFAELIADKERRFIQRRKRLIKEKLKEFSLNQQQLMLLLGHKSKTYMSELINGISPFTLNDLIIIHRLLKIDLPDLVPTTIPHKHQTRINHTLQQLGKEHINLSADDLDPVNS